MPQALQCIAAGVPALIEKPVATSVAEGERLLAAADGKAKLLVGHHRAHSPIMAKAKEVIDSGVGFVSSAVASGNGLANMRDRIEAVGRTLTVTAPSGR